MEKINGDFYYTINPPRIKPVMIVALLALIIILILLSPIYILNVTGNMDKLVIKGFALFTLIMAICLLFREPTIIITKKDIIIESWVGRFFRLPLKKHLPQQKISPDDLKFFTGGWGPSWCTLYLYKKEHKKIIGIHFYLISEAELRKQIRNEPEA